MTDLFLSEHIPEEITRFASHVRPGSNEVLAEMEARAEADGFPIVGPEVGAWLSQLARINDAERVFEFGSGFGYSACWFARALPEHGEIVLTDSDADNLSLAETYLTRLDNAPEASFEVGDAVEIATEYDGEFDIVLLDVEKYQYVDAFAAIRDAIPPGGIVVADNTMTAGRAEPDDTVNFEVLLAALDDEEFEIEDASLTPEAMRHTSGIFDYLEHVSVDPDFETTLLPLGDGVTVTTRLREPRG